VVLDDEANEGEPADEMKDLETTTDTVSVEVGDEMKEVEEAPEESPIPVSAEEPERVEEDLESIEEVVAEEEKEETIVTPATDEETISEKVVEEVEAEVTNVEMEEPKLEETPSVAPKKKGNSTLWIVLLALLLLIAFGLYWIFRSPSQEETQPTPVKVENIVEETPAIVEEPDSSSTLTIEEPAPAISASNEKVATIADTTAYKIVGNKTSYTVQSGETLTKIALKFYGSKNYWPYIAIHNKGTLKNTNQLSVGVKLEIPELKPINE
jgi:nucleoid-associated protein YgaU